MPEQGGRYVNSIMMLTYDDPNTAYDWLQSAFGFVSAGEVYRDEQGVINHGELYLDGTCVALSSPYEPMRTVSPRAVEGRNTAFLYVYVQDVDAHYEIARKAGAEIIEPPADQEYGDRNYRVLDCEGRPWMFGMQLDAQQYDV